MRKSTRKSVRTSAGKRSAKSRPQSARAAVSSHAAIAGSDPVERIAPESKQAYVITILRSASGVTIAEIMQATGWQQHSVRGFLAGVVRKKLKVKLESKKLEGERTYRIGENGSPRSKRPQPKHGAA